jgi:mono/diheme cytochrome c family protein
VKATLSAFALLILSGTFARAETPIERGEYLVRAAAACRGCHTPKEPSAEPLSGGTKFGAGPDAVFAPNITPDKETGIGTWSSRQIVDAVRQGIRPDGSHIGPPMPQRAYASMSDEDAEAIAIYLKSVPSVHHSVPRAASENRISQLKPTASARPQERPPGRPKTAGGYIVNALAHCTECHAQQSSSASNGGADRNDRIFRGPWGVVAAPSISPDALMAYSDIQLAKIITEGRRPDGMVLIGPMPVAAYASLKPADLASIIAYLRDPSQ